MICELKTQTKRDLNNTCIVSQLSNIKYCLNQESKQSIAITPDAESQKYHNSEIL